MNVIELGQLPIGYQFNRREFAVLGNNLRGFAHAGVAAELRANSENTRFGRIVNLDGRVRHERMQRHGQHGQTDVMDRLRFERDMMRALLEKESIHKTRNTDVLLGMFSTQVTFRQLAEPLANSSPYLVEPELLTELRDYYIATSKDTDALLPMRSLKE
jgi:hypothetical protein